LRSARLSCRAARQPVVCRYRSVTSSTRTSRRCQGYSHPPQRLPVQAALSFHALLRQDAGEGLTPPHGQTAPRGARRRGCTVIEPAMRVIAGPLVQFGLDPQYPALRLSQGELQLVGVHQRPPGIPARSLPACWPSLPCVHLSRARTTTGPPPHPMPSADDVPIPPARMDSRRRERRRMLPVFTVNRSISLAPQLCPGSIANDYAANFHHDLPTGTPSRLRCQFRLIRGSGTFSVIWPVRFSWCAGRVCGVGRGWHGRTSGV
jgi:hypothetical protein